MNKELSVVIPTLGGSSLNKTIERLNSGSIVPSEILVCIPENYSSNVNNIDYKNVQILETDICGQVAQRAIGFRNAKHPLVMQIDDDIYVEDLCIEQLLVAANSLGENSAVSPAFINIETGKSVYVKPERNTLLDKAYYWLANGAKGYQPGKVDKSSTPAGIDLACSGAGITEVEWLAGGCVMHHRDNLILDNFYPFAGKAFNEDIIHSHLLKEKGVKLWVNTQAICRLEIIHSKSYSIGEFARNFAADYRSRKYFAQISGRSVIRMHIFYLGWFMSYASNLSKSAFSRLLKRNKSVTRS